MLLDDYLVTGNFSHGTCMLYSLANLYNVSNEYSPQDWLTRVYPSQRLTRNVYPENLHANLVTLTCVMLVMNKILVVVICISTGLAVINGSLLANQQTFSHRTYMLILLANLFDPTNYNISVVVIYFDRIGDC